MQIKFIILIFITLIFLGCKKLLEIPNPANIRSPEKVFSTESDANEAIVGIYRAWKALYNNVPSPTVLGGLSSDELENYSVDQYLEQFEKNDVSSSNPYLPWASLYNIIYQANAAIEGLSNSKSIDSLIKNYFIGEAKFIRAHSYFVLVNYFGGVPLLITSNVNTNKSASRSSVESVYTQVINDLMDSEKLLESNLFANNNYRINKWSVAAFMARVYLQNKNWARADEMASKVINSGKYHLVSDVDSIMIKDNVEALFQFDDNGAEGNIEAGAFIFEVSPMIVLTEDFMKSFENSDIRRDKWISSEQYQNKRYYFPFKYKSRDFVGNERYTMFRLAEQYLIRSEANANIDQTMESVEDINIIRGRANLPLINLDINKDSCLSLILKERRVEFFAETSHRWFDLKRSGFLSEVVSKLKLSMIPSDTIYPIPYDDIIRNRNLNQNPNY